MSKLKLFIENFLVYGFGGITTKVIPLIMVPIITRLMPDASYYGINDMTSTLVNVTGYLCVLGMYDATFRLFFEKDEVDYKKSICSTALAFTLGMSIIIFVLMIIFRKQLALWFYKDTNLSFLVYFAATITLINGTNSIIAAPTRMKNKRRVFLIMNSAIPILAYSITIPLLLKGQYLLALPISALISGSVNEFVFWRLNRKWFSIKIFNTTYLKQLLKIALPICPNFLIYWIFNSSDRVMITHFLGTGETGLYSVGSKLGMASQLIYTAFAGGWQYFSFSTMKEKNQVKSNSLVFEYLGTVSFFCTFFICLIARPFYSLIFSKEYAGSFIVAPYLFLAPLLQMLFQVESNQFLVIKKTWPSFFILLSGAVFNVAFNIVFIPRLGIEGAAIATLLGYTITVIVCTVILIRMGLMCLSWNFIAASVLTVLFGFIWRFFALTNFYATLIAVLVFSLLLFLLYRNLVKSLIQRIIKHHFCPIK